MIFVFLTVLGLVFGSFVNALVWRFHEQAELQERKAKASKGKSKAKATKSTLTLKELSMTHGRSMCSNCHHELASKDLIPVLSWLWLRGKCRYCHVKIQDNPLVEVSTGVLFLLSYLWWPLSLHGVGLFQFIVWLAFVVAFMALTVYDLRWLLLPNRIVFPLIGLAALEVIILGILKGDWRFVLNAAIGGLIIFGMFYILFQLSGGAWIGGGDVKLAVVLGLLAGTPLKAVLVIFLASVIGTVVSLPQLLKNKQTLKMQVPFGPFLLSATVVVVLFGTSITDWYSRLLIR